MNVEAVIYLVGLVVALLVTALANGMQSVLAAAPHTSLLPAARNRVGGEEPSVNLGDVPTSLGTARLLALIGTASLFVALTLLLALLGLTAWMIALVVGVVVVTFVLGYQLPQALVARAPDMATLILAPVIRLIALTLSPVVRSTWWLAQGVARATGQRRLATTAEMTTGVETTAGPDDEPARPSPPDPERLQASVLRFSDTTVREIMRPRLDIVAVGDSTPLTDVLNEIIRVGHSRIPVYTESIDQIVGVLYAKDLLAILTGEGLRGTAADLARPAYFVPESKKAFELLNELQIRKVHMALVVDEYGGIAGLVTIEDLLEEIVGEIQDEYDKEMPLIEPAGDNIYVVDARLSITALNDLLNLPLDSEPFDSVGGLIHNRLERLPAVGDTIREKNVELTVLSVERNRLRKILLTRHQPMTAGAGEPASVDDA